MTASGSTRSSIAGPDPVVPAAVQTADAAAALETLPAEAPAASPAQPVAKEVTILSGRRQEMHRDLLKMRLRSLRKGAFKYRLFHERFKAEQLKKFKNLLIAVSTHGEGDPPDNALSFHEFLHGKTGSETR